MTANLPTVGKDHLVEDDRNVSMSNLVARAAHGLNLAEKRLVALGLVQFDSAVPGRRADFRPNSGWQMRVRAAEYAEAFGVDPTTAYEQLRVAAEVLFDRHVRYLVPGKRGDIEKKYRWVSSCHYAPGEGYVELNFSPEIVPHLANLSDQLTTYKFRHAAGFDSVYAWRLFDYLKSFEKDGGVTVDIERFWFVMEPPMSCRKDFKVLRVRVIEPSVAAIRAKAGMLVDWEPVRSGGRRVTGLTFRFASNPDGPVAIDTVQPGLTMSASQ